MKKRGFTLIELLVAVAILAILSMVGLTMFNNAQRKARDARRRADLKAIQGAAEQYYLEEGEYPNGATNFVAATGVTQYIQAGETGGNNFPVDPRDDTVDYTVSASSTTAYTVCTDLEIESDGTVDSAWDGAATDYCVSQLQ